MKKKILIGFLCYYLIGLVVVNIFSLKYYNFYQEYREMVYKGNYSVELKLWENFTSPHYWLGALGWPLVIPFVISH